MYCKNCGKLIGDTDKFCSYCGFSFINGTQIRGNRKSIYEKIIFLLAILGVSITLLDSWLFQEFYFKPDFITYLIAPLITYILFIYAIIKNETSERVIIIAALVGCISLSLNGIFYKILLIEYIITDLFITPILITIFYFLEYSAIAILCDNATADMKSITIYNNLKYFKKHGKIRQW